MDIQQFLEQAIGDHSLPGQRYLRDLIAPNLAALRHIAIAAHRGWGKTAFLKDIGFSLTEKHEDIRVFYFDLKTIYNSSTFIRKFIQELYRNFSMRIPDRLNLMEPELSMLDLTDTLATRKKVKLIIFISNFQQMARFENSAKFMSKLKYCWKKQKNCAYCLAGHNHLFFKNNFRNIGSPFFFFARVHFLYRRSNHNYTSYVKSLFFSGGKMIDHNTATYITLVTEKHLYYLQVLCWNAFIRTDHTCTVAIAEAAFKSMVQQYKPYLENTLEQLTEKQFNYLRAVLHSTRRICSKESLAKYELGSSSNVARIKENLQRKEIIDIFRDYVTIIDPLVKYWLMLHI